MITILFVIGLGLLAIAGFGYFSQNPGAAQAVLQAFRATTPSQTASRKSSDELDKTAQVRDLRAGEFVEFDEDPNAVARQEREVTSRGKLIALNRSGRNFSPKGEEYELITLEGKVLIERPDGWYVLNKSRILQGDEAKVFDRHGETFSVEHHQVPRSYSFKWGGKELSILDVGYLRYQHEGGRSHLYDGTMIKFMMAETEDGGLFYLENVKEGTDRVWFGTPLGSDLEAYVDKVLRATG